MSSTTKSQFRQLVLMRWQELAKVIEDQLEFGRVSVRAEQADQIPRAVAASLTLRFSKPGTLGHLNSIEDLLRSAPEEKPAALKHAQKTRIASIDPITEDSMTLVIKGVTYLIGGNAFVKYATNLLIEQHGSNLDNASSSARYAGWLIAKRYGTAQ